MDESMGGMCCLAANPYPLKAPGGEGGIRTPDTREGITVFETALFNHSSTSPL